MGAIVIKADSKSRKLLKELAEKLGAEVTDIKDAQYEDFLLGQMMDAEKTGVTVSRAKIMNKLTSK
jgi:heterodisulfide reductase subunit B